MSQVIELESYENIPEYTKFENVKTIKIKDGYIFDGDKYAYAIGFISDNGEKESYFVNDRDNKTTEIFDMLRNDIHLLEKHRNYVNLETLNERKGVEYYIPYKVKNHCSLKPTITNTYVDNCNNVKYDVEYEILFVADEGFTRYITVKYATEGTFASSFFDQVESIESILNDWIDEEKNGFSRNEYNDIMLDFYNEVGEKLPIEISSIRELLSMISSIRVIKCDHTIIK